MEQTKLALSAVMIVAVGLIGTNFVTGLEMIGQEKINAYVDSNPIYGHITIIHSDPDGNILSYTQTDNIVSEEGRDCMSEQIFGDLGDTCGITNTAFNTIGLTSGQSFPVTLNATALKNVDLDGVAGLERAQVTPAENTAASGNTGTLVDIEKTFTAGAEVTGQNVDGAILYNDGEDAALAAQQFTAVSLSTDDTLKITWTITIG